MKKMTFPALAALALFSAAPALAQSPSPSPSPSPAPTQAPAPAPAPTPAPAPAQETKAARSETAKGELVKVDADAKTIAIKGTDGVESVFTYNDRTEVTGAGEGVAGLATKAGTKITVSFTSDMGAKTATKIEVQADKK